MPIMSPSQVAPAAEPRERTRHEAPSLTKNYRITRHISTYGFILGEADASTACLPPAARGQAQTDRHRVLRSAVPAQIEDAREDPRRRQVLTYERMILSLGPGHGPAHPLLGRPSRQYNDLAISRPSGDCRTEICARSLSPTTLNARGYTFDRAEHPRCLFLTAGVHCAGLRGPGREQQSEQTVYWRVLPGWTGMGQADIRFTDPEGICPIWETCQQMYVLRE